MQAKSLIQLMHKKPRKATDKYSERMEYRFLKLSFASQRWKETLPQKKRGKNQFDPYINEGTRWIFARYESYDYDRDTH